MDDAYRFAGVGDDLRGDLRRIVGREFTLDKPIVNGMGTIHIDDTVWRVNGPDCPAGSRVKIARADGANLLVEASA